MFAQVGAVGGEEDDGAVEGAAVALDHPDHQVHVILGREIPQLLHGRAGNIHSAFPVAQVLFASFG